MEICGDNRFEIIAKAKEHLLDATNIDTSEDEMKVLDNFLYRCWQMGWLDRYAEQTEPQTKYPCDTCANDGDHDGECSNCFSDSEVIKWKTPSHYKPKDDPKMSEKLTGSEFIEDRSNWIWVEPTSTTAVEDEPQTMYYPQVDGITPSVIVKDEPYIDIETGILHWCGWKYRRIYEDEPQTDCGDFADRLAYERGVKHAWEVAQKVFCSTVTFYEAEDVAKQIDKDINVRSKDKPQTERSE